MSWTVLSSFFGLIRWAGASLRTPADRRLPAWHAWPGPQRACQLPVQHGRAVPTAPLQSRLAGTGGEIAPASPSMPREVAGSWSDRERAVPISFWLHQFLLLINHCCSSKQFMDHRGLGIKNRVSTRTENVMFQSTGIIWLWPHQLLLSMPVCCWGHEQWVVLKVKLKSSP